MNLMDDEDDDYDSNKNNKVRKMILMFTYDR